MNKIAVKNLPKNSTQSVSQPTLQRKLSLPLLTLYGLGTILGAGIYVLVGKVAGVAGLYAPVAFLLSAILAAFTGYSYAKLSVRFPKSAGEALYIQQAFAWSALATLTGWLVILTGIVSAATLIRGFVGYLDVFIILPPSLTISLLLITITLLACWGIAESVTVAAVITVIELGGLLLVLWVLKDSLISLPTHWQTLTPPLEPVIWLNILLGAFLAFYAFIGFEDMVNVVEEVIEPERNMPVAIFTAVGLSSLLYVLVAIVAVLSLPAAELNNSESPMASLLALKSHNLSLSVAIISLIAIMNGALVQLIMGARILYGMGNQSMAPRWFSAVAPRTRTPLRATITIALIIYLFAAALPVVTLAKITSFIIIAVFMLVNTALLVILLRENNQQTTTTARLKVWEIVIPLIGALSCLSLLVLQSYLLLSGVSVG